MMQIIVRTTTLTAKHRVTILSAIISVSFITTCLLHTYIRRHKRSSDDTIQLIYPKEISSDDDIGLTIPIFDDGVLENIRRETLFEKSAKTQINDKTENLTLCGSEDLEDLWGELDVNSTHQATLEEAIASSGDLLINGCYVPPGCEYVQKIAIVIPYKNRYKHLLTLTNHLHPILQRQRLMYCIFVAEQYDNGSFNKARIMNSAFKEIHDNFERYGHPAETAASRGRPFDCFVYHDVDMLMEDDRNLYMCKDMPVHLSPAIDKFNYSHYYGTIYGGVTAMKAEVYRAVNGHSNRFWGWGGEDNDMERRIELKHLKIHQVNETIGRYKMIVHSHPWWFNPETGTGSHARKQLLAQLPRKKKKEVKAGDKNKYNDPTGLSDIEYVVHMTTYHVLWTKITIDIRNHVFEKVSTHFIKYTGNDVSVSSSSSYHKDEEFDEESEQYKIDPCTPTYHRFASMTINRTHPLDDKRYTTVYYELDAAKDACNEMQIQCQGIVEQMKGRFTLRSTGFAHENKLVYKWGLPEQYHVVEEHHSMAAYVKLCPGDPQYLQFFTTPMVITGRNYQGASPRFYTNVTLRALHPSNVSYTYRTRTMTAHRAIMEAKFTNNQIERIWWDTLGKLQFTKSSLINFGKSDDIAKFRVKTKDPDVVVVNVRSTATTINNFPGCYVVKNTVIDDEKDNVEFDWMWWIQIRAENKEIEDKLLEEMLEESIESGRQFREMMVEKKVFVSQWLEDKKQQALDKERKYAKLGTQEKKGLKPLSAYEKQAKQLGPQAEQLGAIVRFHNSHHRTAAVQRKT